MISRKIWDKRCLQEKHNFIGGERIKFLKLEPQNDNKLNCDTCRNYGDWKVMSMKKKIWCSSCYDNYDEESRQRRNSNEEIEQAIKKMQEGNIKFLSYDSEIV